MLYVLRGFKIVEGNNQIQYESNSKKEIFWKQL